MAKIHIKRLLCPNRHVIGGAAYNPDKMTDEKRIEAGIKSNLRRLGFIDDCAACGSTALHYETSATEFDTIQEAMPTIIAEAEKYARQRAAIQNVRRMARNN